LRRNCDFGKVTAPARLPDFYLTVKHYTDRIAKDKFPGRYPKVRNARINNSSQFWHKHHHMGSGHNQGNACSAV
jgi:hypothetical protein